MPNHVEPKIIAYCLCQITSNQTLLGKFKSRVNSQVTLKQNCTKRNHVKHDLPVLPSSIQTMGSCYKSHTRDTFYGTILITVENNWVVHEIMDHTLLWYHTCLLGTLCTCNILSLFSTNKVLALSCKNLTNGKTQYTNMLLNYDTQVP
jgi:hypothetical protein